MTLDEILKFIGERTEKATPGPWSILNKGYDLYIGNWDIQQKEICSNSDGIKVDNYNAFSPGQADAETTAEFIAHSRTDIPKLLKVIQRLIEQRDNAIFDIPGSEWASQSSKYDTELAEIFKEDDAKSK